MKANEPKCLFCGKTLTGRAGSKFCGDSHRNNYNNSLKAEGSKVIRNTNNALLKDYRILDSLINEGKKKISKTDLRLLGFSFIWCTRFEGDKIYLYDVCYVLKGENVVISK